MLNSKDRDKALSSLNWLSDWWSEDRPTWLPDQYPNRYKDPVIDSDGKEWRKAVPFSIYLVD